MSSTQARVCLTTTIPSLSFGSMPAVYNGETYPSVAHAIAASKVTCEEKRKQIRTANLSARQATKAARPPTRMVNRWESRKQQILMCILKETILGNAELSRTLIETGRSFLFHKAGENEWGEHYFGGTGNVFGKSMMAIRGVARKQEASAAARSPSSPPWSVHQGHRRRNLRHRRQHHRVHALTRFAVFLRHCSFLLFSFGELQALESEVSADDVLLACCDFRA